MKHPITRRSALTGAVASAAALSFAKTSTAASEPKTHEVLISSFEYEPMHLQVKVGDTIQWTNQDLAPHTATADEFGWDTDSLAHGESGQVIVTKDMETSYFCVFHPHMKGTLEILED